MFLEREVTHPWQKHWERYHRPPNWETEYVALLKALRRHVPDIKTNVSDYGWGFGVASMVANLGVMLERPFPGTDSGDHHASMHPLMQQPQHIDSLVRKFAHAFDTEAMKEAA
jgi:hypothetical protein